MNVHSGISAGQDQALPANSAAAVPGIFDLSI